MTESHPVSPPLAAADDLRRFPTDNDDACDRCGGVSAHVWTCPYARGDHPAYQPCGATRTVGPPYMDVQLVCTKRAGHGGDHLDGREGAYWRANGAPSQQADANNGGSDAAR